VYFSPTGIRAPSFPFPAGFSNPPVHLLLSPAQIGCRNWLIGAQIPQRSPQQWMALLNVYPAGSEVNYFFGVPAPGTPSRLLAGIRPQVIAMFMDTSEVKRAGCSPSRLTHRL
jgi:hypothetical protein